MTVSVSVPLQTNCPDIAMAFKMLNSVWVWDPGLTRSLGLSDIADDSILYPSWSMLFSFLTSWLTTFFSSILRYSSPPLQSIVLVSDLLIGTLWLGGCHLGFFLFTCVLSKTGEDVRLLMFPPLNTGLRLITCPLPPSAMWKPSKESLPKRYR